MPSTFSGSRDTTAISRGLSPEGADRAAGHGDVIDIREGMSEGKHWVPGDRTIGVLASPQASNDDLSREMTFNTASETEHSAK